MNWPAELEKEWDIFLIGLENSERGFFLLEYDRPFTRHALLRRLRTEFARRDWSLLPLAPPGRLRQRLENALRGTTAKAALVDLEPAETDHFRALNLARESLHALPTNLIFLASPEAHTRLLTSAHDLATWIPPASAFALPKTAIPDLPPPPQDAPLDLANRLRYHHEQVYQPLEEDDREAAFQRLPPLADLYLEAGMYAAAQQMYQALAGRAALGADQRQANLYARRRDVVHGWRILAGVRAGQLSPENRRALQELLNSGLFSLRETGGEIAIAGKWGRTVPLSPLLLMTLRALSDRMDREAAALESRWAEREGERPTEPLASLPDRHPIFVGRRGETARCLEALSPEERGWGVIIDGIGGIGKTALALEAAHTARERGLFDAYLFASAKTTYLSPDGVRQETLALTSLDAFVREFARLLGQREIIRISDAAERRRAFAGALRNQRILLVWDNLETLSKGERRAISEFLRKLPPPSKAILTSRYRTGESATTIRLEHLSEAEAGELMNEVGLRQPRVAGELKRVGEEARRALYDAAGGNPLALHWTLGLVAAKGYTLEEALARLQDASRTQDLFAFLFADAARDLVQSDQQALVALTAFRTPATQSALAGATGLAPTEVGATLERLENLSLVNQVGEGRYGLHPLTRAYVHAALDTESSEVLRVALGGLELDSPAYRKALLYQVDYARKYGGDGKEAYKTFDRLEEKWPDLEAAANALRDMAGVPGPLRDADSARALNDLAAALSAFLHFRGYWDEWVRLGEWAYAAARALGDWREAGWRARDVAWIHQQRAETGLAATWSDRTTEAMERGGSRRDRAWATHLRGLVARQRGDLDEAERLYTESLATCRELGDETGQATVLNDLGGLAQKREDYDQAGDYYRQALAIDEKREDKEGQAIYTANLGQLALARGRPAEARPWFERALALARQVGRQGLIAGAQAGLALVLEEEGRPAESLPLAEEALRIRERLRDQNLDWTRRLVARLREKAGE